MSALAGLPVTKVEWSSQIEHHGDEEILHLNVRNEGKNLAFLLHAELKHGHSGDDIAPVLWDDNYISLLPGESRTLSASVRTRDLGGIPPQIVVQGWNLKAENLSKAPR
jgi:exo-1,4-beta-D-glucosaminidase